MNHYDYASHEALAEAQARLSEGMALLPIHLLALTQSLAREFYSLAGYSADMAHDFRNAEHPFEQLVWMQACHAVTLLRQCSIDDVIEEYEDDRQQALKLGAA